MSDEIKKVMFICTGNTCRSAMAEVLLKKMLDDLGENDIEVYSSGLHASKGEYSPDEAIIVMKEDYDANLLNHESINIKESNIEEMDLILCLTHAIKTTVEYMYPELEHKIFTLHEYAFGPETEDKDVDDPWGYPIEVYRKCAKEIKESLDEIIRKI